MDLPGAAARRTLGAFDERSLGALRLLALAVMVATAILAGGDAPAFHLTVLLVYVTVAFVVPRLPPFRAFLRRLWTKPLNPTLSSN